MKKYLGLIVLTALAGTAVLAVNAAPSDKQARSSNTVSDAQISQLDKRLGERVIEQQELLVMVEKLLRMDYVQKVLESPDGGNVLSGRVKPPAPPVAPAGAKAVKAVAPPPPPWWLSYTPQMVYVSNTERYAVVNGKMFMIGQTLGNDVLIDKIEDDLVVLRQGNEHHTFFLKK